MVMPTGWKMTPLGDVCSVTPGFAFKSRDWQDDGIPVVRIKNIQSDRTVNTSECAHVPESLFSDKLSRFVLHNGDILVAMTGATAGKVGRLRSSRLHLLNQRVAKLAPTKEDYHYIWAVISSDDYERRFFHLADGAAQPNMSGSQIESLEIPFPPLPVRRKIGRALSAYDDLIENNERRIRILEEMAQNLHREWFVKFRFPGHEKVKMVDSPLGKIPERWEVVSLGDWCLRVTDGSHSSPKSVETGFPMASVKDMTEWGLNETTCRRISADDFDKLVRNDCKPLKNDVLIAKDGSYLKHVFVIDDEKNLVVLSSIAILRPNPKAVLPYVLCMCLRQPEIKTRLSGYVSGAALPRIILKDFIRFPLVDIPMRFQKDYSERMGGAFQLIQNLRRHTATLRQTRDLLLPKLISGQLDVSELDIEVPEEAA